ncbi:unnamed protein product [Durusdinium trenchii]|uniref:Uncharacterized protein n=1 Tax=Durusdinium trenchii TaxID=1381693 RepID=A0ABP0HHN5_9DINO
MILEHGDESLVTVATYACFLAKCAVTAFFTIAYVYITEIFPSARGPRVGPSSWWDKRVSD